jgi:hypothetical protein
MAEEERERMGHKRSDEAEVEAHRMKETDEGPADKEAERRETDDDPDVEAHRMGTR